MTEPQPPLDVVPVMAEVVAGKPGQAREREPNPRGLGLVILAIVCAVFATVIAILLVHSGRADLQRRELACQVQELGGKPIGGVRCPPASKHPSPSPRATSSRAPATIVVRPSAGGAVLVRPAPAPSPVSASSPRPSATPVRVGSPRPSPSRRSSPGPSCTPLPVVGCVG